MANQVYNHFKMHVLSGDIDLSTATMYMMLCSGSYTFSHNHEVTGDITNEITSSNYDRGGKLIPNTAILIDSVDNEAVLSGDNMTYSGLTSTLEYGVIWVSGASASTRYLVGQIDFGSQSLTNSDFVVSWNSEGIYNLM